MSKILLVFVLAGMQSCKSIDIKPGSERIRVFDVEPKGCVFVGEIPSVQENTITGQPPTEIDMELPTRVELRNKAHELGGNVIVFMNKNKNKAPGDAKKPAPTATEVDKSEKKISTVFLATVFRCPSAIVNQ